MFGSKNINHLAYTDDLIIFCPSIKGLQLLIHQCELYAESHDIKYNQSKTVGMVIQPHGFKLLKCLVIFKWAETLFCE